MTAPIKIATLDPRFFVTPWIGMPPGTSYASMLEQRRAMGLSLNCPCGCGERILMAFKEPLDGGPMTSEDLPIVEAALTGAEWDDLQIAPWRQADPKHRAWQVVGGEVIEVFG